jgi:CRP-like cAMP-binding protein
MKIHEVRLQKHEVIFEEGDAEEDPALFIIERGEIGRLKIYFV